MDRGNCTGRLLFAGVFFAAAVLTGGAASAEKQADSQFRQQIAPILVGRCLECHGEDRKGGLDLTSKAGLLAGGESGEAIVPGKPDESLLFQYVKSGEMPPKHPLKRNEIATLRRWIMAGAHYPDVKLSHFSLTTESRAGYDWWSYQPIQKSKPPPVRGSHAARARTPLDRFVLARLEKAGLTLSPPADRATWDPPA